MAQRDSSVPLNLQYLTTCHAEQKEHFACHAMPTRPATLQGLRSLHQTWVGCWEFRLQSLPRGGVKQPLCSYPPPLETLLAALVQEQVWMRRRCILYQHSKKTAWKLLCDLRDRDLENSKAPCIKMQHTCKAALRCAAIGPRTGHLRILVSAATEWWAQLKLPKLS